MTSGPVPKELRWVALIFLFSGISSIVTMIVCAADNRLQLDFGFLGIFAYWGLLRLSNAWRLYALFCTCLQLILLLVVGLFSFTASHANINILGFIGPAIPPFLALIPLFFWFCVARWQLKILTRPDIAMLFTANAISRF